jgi:hypothetical protein
MTRREFNWLLRHMKPRNVPVTKFVRGMLNAEQAARIEEPDMVKERNVRKRSPSFWRRTFIDQAWRIMYPNEELK